MTHAAVPTYLLTSEVGHPFMQLVVRLVEEHALRSVCDFGGGANPVLPADEITRLRLRYLVVDVSSEELAKAPPGYDSAALDVTAGVALDLPHMPFDLVISRFVAEHVEDPAAFHTAVWQALRPGGFAAHFFPTLPSPPYVANRLLMGRGSRWLVDILQPGSRSQDERLGKFHAYYRWCAGPTRRQYRRYASLGFEIVDYVVLVGHRYYERFPPLQRAADAVSRQAVRLRRPALATYACVVLRRPLA
jgi:SAM-dependent methyltransferase